MAGSLRWNVRERLCIKAHGINTCGGDREEERAVEWICMSPASDNLVEGCLSSRACWNCPRLGQHGWPFMNDPSVGAFWEGHDPGPSGFLQLRQHTTHKGCLLTTDLGLKALPSGSSRMLMEFQGDASCLHAADLLYRKSCLDI